jgi:hypothetical protein
MILLCALSHNLLPSLNLLPSHITPFAAHNSREAALGISALSQTLAQQNPAAIMAQNPQALAQNLAGMVASEVLPLVKAELAASIGPWLADSSASLKRLDTRLAVSRELDCVPDCTASAIECVWGGGVEMVCCSGNGCQRGGVSGSPGGASEESGGIHFFRGGLWVHEQRTAASIRPWLAEQCLTQTPGHTPRSACVAVGMCVWGGVWGGRVRGGGGANTLQWNELVMRGGGVGVEGGVFRRGQWVHEQGEEEQGRQGYCKHMAGLL